MGEKGKKKSRILLIVCGLLLLAGAIIGIVMFRMQAGASAYNESIKTAEKYADSGEYELAVLTYENAIKDRPKEEEGYLGLADRTAVYETDGGAGTGAGIQPEASA